MGGVQEHRVSMICILSQAVGEVSTEFVIDWLKDWKVPFVRLNGEDIKTGHISVSLDRDGTTLLCKAENVAFNPALIKVVWFRRWGSYAEHFIQSQEIFADTQREGSQTNTVRAVRHLIREFRTISHFIFDSLSSARWLSDPVTGDINKLRALKLAAECQVDIPDTLVSNDRSELSSFIAKYDRVITKPLSEGLICNLDNRSLASYTSVADESMLAGSQNDRVFPTILQECLDKEYEIRSFYLDGRFYSMAIFSQSDEQTNVDFRRYQFKRPNRTVPYRLPDDLSSKLKTLMQKLGLETGSLDLVKTVDERFVFLEINPGGQFGMVSHPCNYHLEREVALALVRRLDDA
jgi:ATP-GRASP peptide maturase of grasp-with-spasm system